MQAAFQVKLKFATVYILSSYTAEFLDALDIHALIDIVGQPISRKIVRQKDDRIEIFRWSDGRIYILNDRVRRCGRFRTDI